MPKPFASFGIHAIHACVRGTSRIIYEITRIRSVAKVSRPLYQNLLAAFGPRIIYWQCYCCSVAMYRRAKRSVPQHYSRKRSIHYRFHITLWWRQISLYVQILIKINVVRTWPASFRLHSCFTTTRMETGQCHGSCCPGLVLSIVASYTNHANPQKRQVHHVCPDWVLYSKYLDEFADGQPQM
jgi:hypothetical protein